MTKKFIGKGYSEVNEISIEVMFFEYNLIVNPSRVLSTRFNG